VMMNNETTTPTFNTIEDDCYIFHQYLPSMWERESTILHENSKRVLMDFSFLSAWILSFWGSMWTLEVKSCTHYCKHHS
jgi:hypothetical protein